MHRLRAALGVLVLAALAAPAGAQTADCSAAKIQAAGAYFSARANCVAKGLAKGLEPDALCIAKALEKLGKAFAKAEGKGACKSLADLAPGEDVLADALEDGFDAVSQLTATCCINGSDNCRYRNLQDCIDSGGTPGAAGTACLADGTCGAFDAAATGTCCDVVEEVPGFEGACLTGATLGAICQSEGLPVTVNGNCHPEVGCIAESSPPRTKCTSAKLKAQGRYLSSAAKCHAKAVKKGEPVDITCLAKAESKITKAFANAEKKADCLGRSDLGAALGVLSDARELSVAIHDPQTTFCCEGALGCTYTQTSVDCVDIGGTPVGTGECDADGTCKAPPLEEGGCCQGVPLGSIDRCIAGVTSLECTNLTGEFDPDALCLMAQVCID